jgi:hypothetical protein
MEPTYYLYSKFYGWTSIIFFSGMAPLMLYPGIASHNVKLLLICSVLTLGICAFIYYLIRALFIPAVKNYVALELDDEKAHCYITDRTVYWKDVVEISEDYSQYSTYIRFDMIDETSITMPTKWIQGRTSKICNTMQDYFAKTL